MKQFRLCHFLAPLLVLLTPRAISAVGRGPPRVSSLSSEAPGSTGTNTVYQGQSPAEMEEEEELDGNQEQGLDQEDSPAQSPAQMLTQSSAQPPAAPAVPPILDTSLVQNPAGPKVVETFNRDLGSKPLSFQGPPQERQSSQFLSYPNAGQLQDALPDQPHALSTSDASAAVAELAALSSTSSSILPMVKPEKSLLTSFQTGSQSSPSSAKSFSPAVPLQSVAKAGSALKDSIDSGSFHAEPKNNFDTSGGSTDVCHPPCIQGRGICNDSMCFCKSPYSGTTCQHKMAALSRIKYPMLVGLCGVAVVFGVLFAQVLHGFITTWDESKLAKLGQGTVRQEVWMPPENSKGKKK